MFVWRPKAKPVLGCTGFLYCKNNICHMMAGTHGHGRGTCGKLCSWPHSSPLGSVRYRCRGSSCGGIWFPGGGGWSCDGAEARGRGVALVLGVCMAVCLESSHQDWAVLDQTGSLWCRIQLCFVMLHATTEELAASGLMLASLDLSGTCAREACSCSGVWGFRL